LAAKNHKAGAKGITQECYIGGTKGGPKTGKLILLPGAYGDGDALSPTEVAIWKVEREKQGNTVNVAKFALILFTVALMYRTINEPRQGLFNLYLSLVWSLYLPIAVCGIVAALRHQRVRLSWFPFRTRRRVIFLVPTVCREDTLPALTRVVDSILRHAPRNLDDFVAEVVVDELAPDAPDAAGRQRALATLRERYAGAGQRVRLTVVPLAYRTPNGTRHKARANQYALERRRRGGENTADTYVYHLDDDTHVGADTVASIAEFLCHCHDHYYLAQGTLTFPFELSPSWLCRLADSVRPVDDLTRFRFFTGMLGTPLNGLHGEHLLVRADVEEGIGWDFGPAVLVEDAYFALHFADRHPGRSTTLDSFSYGASPETVQDLVRQRRRWFAGLFRLALDRSVPLRVRLPMIYAVLCWGLGPFQAALPIFLFSFASGIYSTSPVTGWITYVWCFNFTYFLWQYLEGFKINLSVSTVPRRGLVHVLGAVALVPGIWLISLVETTAALLGLWQAVSRREVSFQVIRKTF
jgi:beta-1,4-mannosyltransferase